jgi:catechol 2,3-dioxygenase-like lactoylglutathione lyase family enzyme
MMQGPTGWILTLAIGYVGLAALLLWSLLAARAPFVFKLLTILAVSGFYVAGFFGLRALPGYASDERLPESFKLLGARIVEPKTIPGDPGSIYLWVEPMDDNNLLSGRPRAFRLRWSEPAADKVVNALKRSNEGHPQAGRTGHGKDSDDWLGPNAGLTLENAADAKGKEAGDAARDDGVEFTPMQAPTLPGKDDQLAP